VTAAVTASGSFLSGSTKKRRGTRIRTVFLYDGIAIVLGAFGVPTTYGWTLPLPDGSTIAIRGIGETAYRGYSAWYEATYRAASGDGRSGAIGTWYGKIGLSPVVYAAGTRILLAPGPSRVFVARHTVSGGLFRLTRSPNRPTRC
jgi:hypothetical protein